MIPADFMSSTLGFYSDYALIKILGALPLSRIQESPLMVASIALQMGGSTGYAGGEEGVSANYRISEGQEGVPYSPEGGALSGGTRL